MYRTAIERNQWWYCRKCSWDGPLLFNIDATRQRSGSPQLATSTIQYTNKLLKIKERSCSIKSLLAYFMGFFKLLIVYWFIGYQTIDVLW